MTPNDILQIVAQGEGVNIEFKTSEFELNKDVFESVCAFLNSSGGMLVLGVKNDGSIKGVFEGAIQQIMDSLVSGLNNPQQLNPTFYLSPGVIQIDEKSIIYLKVPESSQVHQSKNKIFVRNEDGDFDVTNNQEIVKHLYQRKSNVFTENTIYPYLKFEHFRPDLIKKVRTMASNVRPNHPWQSLDNEGLLKSAQLFQTNYKTNESGYTLAAVLLFGRDDVIKSILPAYKTDAILRIRNIDRYDDRDEVRTNLIDSYERLMQFIRKHLPDPFYLEGDKRVSLREMIFREAIANTLIHREFTNAYPARMIIEKNKVTIDNWNLPVKYGLISPDLFYTHPKNPNILQVFKEIRMADELGSGVRNMYKYTAIYAKGKLPKIEEMEFFKVTVPYFDSDLVLKNKKSGGVDFPNDGVNFPNDEVNFPNDGVNFPNDGVNSPNDGVNSPNDGVNLESGGVDFPNDGVNDTANDGVNDTTNLIKEKNDTANAETVTARKIDEGVKSPSEGVNLPSEGVNLPSEGVKLPSEGIKLPSEGIKLPSEGVIENVIQELFFGAKRNVKSKLKFLLSAIAKNEGKRIPDYDKNYDLGTNRTVERYFHLLKEARLIEFIGDSRKTGGYFLTKECRHKIAEKST
ncbi:MAG: putative DNA binding domain-containing protein [Bacteroidales bacterium]|nr:putative DNA binding domain-containing protein [Bacteroidales bacterium]MCF8458729.1 putative DNA binding domain-containing protein [Bacteroidales bacterium]